jgi:hypothetical protein
MSGQPTGLVVISDPQGFLRATVCHHLSLQGMLAVVDDLEARTKGGDSPRILLDLFYVQPPGPVEQPIVGEHMARHLSQCHKVASIVAPGTRTGISEQVARRLHLDLRVFTSEADGVAWVTS